MKLACTRVWIAFAATLAMAQHPPAPGGESPVPRMSAGKPLAFVNVQVIPMDRERFITDVKAIFEFQTSIPRVRGRGHVDGNVVLR